MSTPAGAVPWPVRSGATSASCAGSGHGRPGSAMSESRREVVHAQHLPCRRVPRRWASRQWRQAARARRRARGRRAALPRRRATPPRRRRRPGTRGRRARRRPSAASTSAAARHASGMRSDAPGLLTEPLQQSRPALADDAVGRLDDRVEDAVDAPALAADAGERVIEVALLGVAVPMHRQQRVLEVGRLAGAHHLVEVRRDVGPDFRPHVGCRAPEGPRMLGPGNRAPGVVVEEDQVGPPVDRDGQGRPGADAERRSQALRPRLDRPDRSPGPVEGPHAGHHVAAADERIRGVEVTRTSAGGGEPRRLPSCRRPTSSGTTLRLLRTDFTPSMALAMAAARADPACVGTVPLSVATPASTSTSMSLPSSTSSSM